MVGISTDPGAGRRASPMSKSSLGTAADADANRAGPDADSTRAGPDADSSRAWGRESVCEDVGVAEMMLTTGATMAVVNPVSSSSTSMLSPVSVDIGAASVETSGRMGPASTMMVDPLTTTRSTGGAPFPLLVPLPFFNSSICRWSSAMQVSLSWSLVYIK